ncbi:SIS domain-containing protein [Enterococcus dongliensis]|uniref:SIS domain-containing protein n=1 Tax=Enterococcus dongliensis TaxID=2559925 RepID=A0AAW8TNS4_9ENTE|nr:SIS domain-containing protein [Enterococcus dongliensis]MDT2596930.1 SIS domain-containing protein [Enterococcus dongliensis]MDT2604514.1 SIS domain-containing protein [Enterococcus dongliensis]MDT2613267.1 SIS domain-containing protein [Enterococcus dongliensis]MDT2634668.1 SIS domain-containing protein [Enterococcus dongliensis]MDT2637720.1 SIS domain-containing protein [Enterococcus dongliensis]
MFQYFDRIREILKEVESSEAESIEQAVTLLTDANLNKQGIYIFGASHAGILAEELYYRAGGMMTINAIFGRELMLDQSPITVTSKMERLEGYGTTLASTIPFKRNDILILHSVSGRNPVTIDLALAAKNQGVKIIALTNVEYSKQVSSRHSSGKRLFEVADIVLDNHGDTGDGCCSIEGIEQKVGPSSTVVGATILNTIIVEVTRKLVEHGIEYPPIFYSANLDGGDQLNQELFKKYEEVIHYSL